MHDAPRRVRSPWPVSEPVTEGASGCGPPVAPGAEHGNASEHVSDHGSRGRGRALLSLARPRQWVKNALVVAAPGAAGALGRGGVPVRVALACVAFCLISAGVYALNDVRDHQEDRRHPRKRLRPVAAGELLPAEAILAGVAWLAAGLILCAAVRPLLLVVGLGYVALSLSYTWVWRRLPALDLAAVSAGFILRAIAGGVAASVAISPWFALVVTCAALFVAAGKRLAELQRAQVTGRPGRRVLQRYSRRGLHLALIGSSVGAVFAYWVWAFAVPDIDGTPWRPLTAIPFTLCLLRYGNLVRDGAGEAPEELLTSDWLLVAGGLLWVLLFAVSVNATG
ncbi:MAG: decaprenyl-phosphate phosphoribosyltransferase [Solirubrobacteraceae bacterium]